MNARTLVATLCRSWIRRGAGGGALSGALASALAMAAMACACAVGHRWAIDAGADVERVRGHLFWLAVFEVFIFAYTTFEIAFRARDRRFVGLLPISGATRWLDLSARNLVVHLPLLAPGLGYAWGLTQGANHALFPYALALTVGTYVVGVPLCSLLHLKAGLSLLSPPGAGRKMLAGTTVPADAAMLLYTPALGLAGTLVCVLVMDGLLRAALLRDDASLVTTAGWTLLTATAIGIALVARAAREADGALHRVAARFSEFDVPTPYREDGLPERTPGLGWGRLLPASALPFFERDLKQLRRRFRLDRILLWIASLIALRLGWTATEAAAVFTDLFVLAAVVTLLVCHGPLAAQGPELGSPWLRRSLPSRPWPRALGSWLAFSSAAGWIWWWSAVAMWMAAGPELAARMLVGGLATVSTVWAGAWCLARGANPERLGAFKLIWHALGVVVIAFAAGRFG